MPPSHVPALALRDVTNRAPSAAFNRDLAKSALLNRATPMTARTAATSAKLLETLGGIKADGKGVSVLKMGAARRVAVGGATPSPAAPTVAAAIAPPAAWLAEKDQLVQTVARLEAQLAQRTEELAVALAQNQTLRAAKATFVVENDEDDDDEEEGDASASNDDTVVVDTPAAITAPKQAEVEASCELSSIVPAPASPSPLRDSPLADEFEPINVDEINASLNQCDLSTHSLNLSSSSMSPHQLPASFLSPKEAGLLSPIERCSPMQAPAPTLSASALKIQSLFRGRMERGYLAQETRLAGLPLTSPSTPSATPNAKRQKRSISPVAMRSIVLEDDAEMEEDEEEETTQITRQLSFKAAVEDSIASALSSASSSSVASPPVSPMSSADAKRFSSELRQARAPLASLDACWTLRSKAMNRVEELVRERSAYLPSWAGWKDELAHLQRGMGVQLSDLRSSILREACRLLIAMADASPRDFEEHLTFYLPILCKSLYVTIKIIRETADETMVELVSRVATPRTMPLLLAGLTDVHPVVREKSATYLQQVLRVSKVADVESVLPALTAGLRQGLGDSDSKSRLAWRGVFECVTVHAPAAMQTVLESLPSAVQKAIEADRKANKKTAGKRKK